MTVPLSLHLGGGGAEAGVTSASLPPFVAAGASGAAARARCSRAPAGRPAARGKDHTLALLRWPSPFSQLAPICKLEKTSVEEQVCQAGHPERRAGPGGGETGTATVPRADHRRGGSGATARTAGPLARPPPLARVPHHPFRKPPWLPWRPGSPRMVAQVGLTPRACRPQEVYVRC